MLQRLGASSSDKPLNCAVELNGTVPCPSVNSKGTESSTHPQSKVHVSYLSFQDKGDSMYWVTCRGENAKIDGIFRISYYWQMFIKQTKNMGCTVGFPLICAISRIN